MPTNILSVIQCGPKHCCLQLDATFDQAQEFAEYLERTHQIEVDLFTDQQFEENNSISVRNYDDTDLKQWTIFRKLRCDENSVLPEFRLCPGDDGRDVYLMRRHEKHARIFKYNGTFRFNDMTMGADLTLPSPADQAQMTKSLVAYGCTELDAKFNLERLPELAG